MKAAVGGARLSRRLVEEVGEACLAAAAAIEQLREDLRRRRTSIAPAPEIAIEPPIGICADPSPAEFDYAVRVAPPVAA
jgi:hypothetical protein